MRSLRSRLTFTHALVAFVAVAIVAIMVTILIRLVFERQRAQINSGQMQSVSDTFAGTMGEFYQRQHSWANVDVRLRQQYLRAAANTPLKRFHLQLLDAQGRVLFDTAFPGGLRQSARITTGVESPVIVDEQPVGKV